MTGTAQACPQTRRPTDAGTAHTAGAGAGMAHTGEAGYAEIGRELAVCLRRLGRLHALAGPGGSTEPTLDRAAYLLLSRIVGQGPARLSALAAAAHLDVSTISRQVAALEAAGLVEKTTDPADRRAHVIAATGGGHRMLACTRKRWEAVLEELLRDWAPAERAEFVRLLARFNAAIEGRSAVVPAVDGDAGSCVPASGG